MEKGVWAYPWDLLAEPDCALRHADMGLSYVCVATRYHAVRALSYRADGPRITTHLGGRSWLDETISLSARYSAVGIALDAWIVCFHEDPAPEGQRIINCLGDEYPWASCPRHPEARGRILSFIERTAATGAFRTLELEAFGFYGFSHGSEHDKLPMLSNALLSETLSVCCCPRCRAASGVQSQELAAFAQRMLHTLHSEAAPSADSRPSDGTESLDRILEAEAAARLAYCDELLADAIDRVGDRASIRLQVSPDTHALGAARPVPAFGTPLPDEMMVPVWSSDPHDVRVATAEVLSRVHERSPETQHGEPRVRPRVLAGFATIPPHCCPAHVKHAVETVLAADPAGLCAYHDGMMHPDARRAYAQGLAAQS